MRTPKHRHAGSWPLNRRDWLRVSTAGMMAGSASGWFDQLAAQAAESDQRKRACILLWMNGGPSQMDTFDLKPGHENGGPFQAIETSAPGLKISEHLPKLAKHGEHLAVLRSMSTKEGDHSRATHTMRTGYGPTGPVSYPSIGPLIGKELGSLSSELPSCVSIAPFRSFSPSAFGPGFLGPNYAPLLVGDGQFGSSPQIANSIDEILKVQNLSPARGVSASNTSSRLNLLKQMEEKFAANHPSNATSSRRAAYKKALLMMGSKTTEAFDLTQEPDELRDAYGRNLFGQGCLLARRLVERGVPFVEVSLTSVPGQNFFGWDTHQNNFEAVQALSGVLDAGWGTLMEDLTSTGLIDTTTILWMGEFGRTPIINTNTGRDHYPKAWTTVLAGGGIAGGQAVGATSPDGIEVADRPIGVGDLLATLITALGIDPMQQNMSNVGRPIRLADPEASPVKECLL